MEFSLSDDQRRMVGTVRALVRKQMRPNAQRYMDGSFPWDNIRALAEIGVLGMAVPEAYGGMELPVLDTALVLEEIAKGCYPTAMAVLGEVGTQTRIIAAYAPDGIKERILPAVATGDCILSICMTEPHAGTDVAAYTTNTVVDGNTARVNGVKTLISRAEEAGMFVVFTRVDGRPGREGIGCVLLYRACVTADPFPDALLAATAKTFCNEMAIRVTSEAVQIHGGYGYTDECPASRLYRAARYGSLGGGTTETLKDLIGRRLMATEGSPFD